MSTSSQAFWNFSLDVYQICEVQTALLDAQHTHGLNVNLALFCLFLNKQNIYLTEQQIIELNKPLVVFNSEFTNKVRELRNFFKTKQALLGDYTQLRQSMLKAELILEQQEQQILTSTYATFDQFSHQQTDNISIYQSILLAQNTSPAKPALKLSDLNQYIL